MSNETKHFDSHIKHHREANGMEQRTKWQTLTVQEVVARQNSSLTTGLSPSEVEARQKSQGSNVLSLPIQTPAWRRFLSQFENPLVIILLVAAVASFLAGRPTDSLTILAVTIVNAIIGFVQEQKAQSAIDALTRMVKTECQVIRGTDQPRKIDAAELVPGDLVLLSSGDRVPADLRFAETKNLQVNESALTGESLPVEKITGIITEETGLGDRRNMGFSGTLVTSGSGKGLVVEIGDRTEIGLINALMNRTENLQTPLMARLENFSKLFGIWVIGFALMIFTVGIMRGMDMTEMFMAAVSAAVGAIPEGLPAVMTIVLAIGVKNMADRKAIIRKLPAVETLGSVTVICSDKTGTLTANEMTVQTMVTGSGLFSAEGVGFNPGLGHVYAQDHRNPSVDTDLRTLLTAGTLCNDAQLVHGKAGWGIEGDPTEGALLTIAAKAGYSIEDLRRSFPRIDVQPFDSGRQLMVTLNRHESDSYIWVKGSMERLLPLCSHAWKNNAPAELDQAEISQQVNSLARQGMRVLAFAFAPWSGQQLPEILPPLRFIGLQAMIDPPRPEVRDSLAVCQKAGIVVKMITGDHPATAKAVADDLGIPAGQVSCVTGVDINSFSDEELLDVTRQTSLFARVAPEHKFKLVEAFQKQNDVVAMTGDGVNDAPALKRADIGVAMGISGTEVAKDASDMILLDDNFSTLVRAVEEGRNVFNNLVKSMVYILPTNTAQGLVIFLAILVGYRLPITPVQVLWVNLLTAFLSLPLAFEIAETGLMDRKPRAPDAPLIEKALVLRIVVVALLMTAVSFFVFFYERKIMGSDLATARTAVVSAMIAVEFFYLFSARALWTKLPSLSPTLNPVLWPCLLATVALQLSFSYIPFFQKMMESAPIDAEAWAVLLAVSATVIPIVEFMKRFR